MEGRAASDPAIVVLASLLSVALTFGATTAARGFEDAVRKPTPAPTPAPFSNPQLVTINGYTQDAEEPFVSRDGNILFFDNSNDPARNPNTDIFWATRLDEVTFQYQGPVAGVDTPGALEGVPSMDLDNNFYFISPRNYVAPDFATIYAGPFSNGDVSAVLPVAGISRRKAGRVNFDAEISADGTTLYFVDSVFKNNQPNMAKIEIAHKNGSTFVRDPHSTRLMAQINSGRLQYAPDVSASELELFFNRAGPGGTAIYAASRTDTSMPFGKPQKIAAITGFAEGPSISPDGKSLYYHHQDADGVFRIYRVTRP